MLRSSPRSLCDWLGGTRTSIDVRDQMDTDGLDRAMNEEVIPRFYDLVDDGLLRGWLARMKSSIRSLGWRFNSDRMVMDYVMKCSIPAVGGTSSDMSRR